MPRTWVSTSDPSLSRGPRPSRAARTQARRQSRRQSVATLGPSAPVSTAPRPPRPVPPLRRPVPVTRRSATRLASLSPTLTEFERQLETILPSRRRVEITKSKSLTQLAREAEKSLTKPQRQQGRAQTRKVARRGLPKLSRRGAGNKLSAAAAPTSPFLKLDQPLTPKQVRDRTRGVTRPVRINGKLLRDPETGRVVKVNAQRLKDVAESEREDPGWVMPLLTAASLGTAPLTFGAGGVALGIGGRGALGIAGSTAARGVARVAPKAVGKHIASRQVAREIARSTAKRSVGKGLAKRGVRSYATGGSALPGGAGNLAKAPVELGRATVEDPGKVAKASFRTFKDSLYGLPAATAMLVTDPLGAADAIAEDYSYRYGPLVAGNTEEFRKRVKESGLTPFAFDALVAAPPAGRIAGSAARKGTLGSRAERLANRQRPDKRVSAGRAVEQPTSKNLGAAAAQAVIDKARAKRGERAKERGEAVQPRPGEVLSLRGKGRRTRDVATRKGRAYIAFTGEQNRELGRRGAVGEISKLSKDERRGLKYAIQFGVRDPSTAKAVLLQRIDEIRDARAKGEGGIGPGYVAPGKLDEIPEMEALIRDADAVFTPRLGEVARLQRQRAKRTAARDPGFGTDAQIIRTYRQQGELLGVKPREGETGRAYAGRVIATAKKAGLDLDAPGYFPSQMKNRPNYSVRAVGGSGAVAGPKKYHGRTYELGIEDARPEALVEGLAANVKRAHNWRLVADTADEHTFDWSRNKSMREILEEAHRRGIDPANLAFWNPKRFRAQRAAQEGIEGEQIADDLAIEGVGDALKGEQGALQTLEELGGAANDEAFLSSRGWSAIPRDINDEITAVAKGSGVAGRSLEIAKGKASRFLLGSINLPWLQFQMASNALLTGLAGTGPLDLIRAQKWWHNLSDAQKAEVEPYIGAGHHAADTRQTKLGASTNKGFVNAYRAFKSTLAGKGIWRTGGRVQLSDLNPLDLMFRADNAQNNFFRKGVLYSQVKRDAYRRMGESTNALGRIQNRLVPRLGEPVQKQMDNILSDAGSLETHARHVSDFLGDYTNFTRSERIYLQRNVMFYGFLRFSLRFTFYTMPLKHPVMTGILGNLGKLKADEVRELLGGDELPFALGRIYDDEGRVKVDLARLNPAMNVISQSNGLNQMFSLLPPYFTHIAEQAANKDFFTGKEFLVEGETQARKWTGIGLENRLRILGREGLNLFYPSRVAEEFKFMGRPQGADSLFFDPRPTQYSAPEITESIGKSVRERQQQGPLSILGRQVSPFLGVVSEQFREPASDQRTAKRIRSLRKEEKKRLKPGGSSSDPFEHLFDATDSSKQFDKLFKD